MDNQDKPNGNLTNVEMQLQIDAVEKNWFMHMQHLDLMCRYRKEKYDRLIKAGFTEHQALDIVKSAKPFE